MSGIERVAAGIEAELARRLPRQRRTQRRKLALLVATMLSARSANLMDLAAALPRPAERAGMPYQWTARLLANSRLACDTVGRPVAGAGGSHAGAERGTGGLLLDPRRISARHQMLVLAVRVGERALPLAWRVRATEGSIGFAEQRELLTRVAASLPAGGRVVLMGDRFYGTPDLIALCQALGWGWRLRLKQDLLVFEDGGETTVAECFARGEHMLSGVELTEKRVASHVAMVHEPGHPEPWIIALSEAPTVHRAFDYGLRGGVEAMSSDFKTRGFGLEDSHILSLPRRRGRVAKVDPFQPGGDRCPGRDAGSRMSSRRRRLSCSRRAAGRCRRSPRSSGCTPTSPGAGATSVWRRSEERRGGKEGRSRRAPVH